MKNPGLYAADSRGRLNGLLNSSRAGLASAVDRQLCRGGRVIAAGPGTTGRSGRVHRADYLSHPPRVALEEPEHALPVDHRADPMILQSLFHAADVARPPQAVSNQVSDLAFHRGAPAVG